MAAAASQLGPRQADSKVYLTLHKYSTSCRFSLSLLLHQSGRETQPISTERYVSSREPHATHTHHQRRPTHEILGGSALWRPHRSIRILSASVSLPPAGH